MRFIGAGLAATLSTLFLTAADLRAAGQIAGTVNDTETNAIASVWVDAYDAVTNYSGYADSDGTYSIPDVPAGTYFVRTDVVGANFIDEWHDDIPVTGPEIPVGVTAVTVVDGVTTNVDFLLTQGGAIAGQVTDTSTNAAGLSNIWVDAYDESGYRVGSALSETNGDYEIIGLFGNTYYVRTDSFGQNFVDQWFDNAAVTEGDIPLDASPVEVYTGWTTGNVDFALAEGSMISGNVSDRSTQAVSNVWVDAYTSDGQWLRSGYTDTGGDYLVAGLPDGTFFARTYVGGLNYANEWYDDIAVTGWDIPDGATALFLTSGVTRADVDFSLADGAIISGAVTGAGGWALADVGVDVYMADSTWMGRGTTDTNGNYAVAALPEQTYYARTEAGDLNYIDEWHFDIIAMDTFVPTNAVPIAATSGATAAGIDFSLDRGGVVAGRVTDEDSNPIVGPTVDAFDVTDGHWIASGPTDTGGTYAIVGLASGLYSIRTYASPANYADEWYANVPVTGALLPEEAAEVSITAGLTNAGVNFALAAGAAVSGLVSEASLLPGTTQGIAGVSVELYDSNGTPIADDVTAYDGTYEISSLGAGVYYARVDVGTEHYIEEWYSNVVAIGVEFASNATPFSVTTGATRAGIDFALDEGGSITGEVLRADLSGVADMAIDLYTLDTNWFGSVTTDAYGDYSAPGLPVPGPYHVRTYAGSEPYVDEWFDDTWVRQDGIPADAQPVAALTGATAGAASFLLEAGGSISGGVRDGGGSPIAGIGVSLVDTNGLTVLYGVTDGNGAYSLGRAPAATYYARSDAGGSWFVDEWYDDVPLSGEGGIAPAAVSLNVTNNASLDSVSFVLGFPVVDAQAAEGLFSLYWQGAAGTTYQVEQSTDLAAWSNAPSGSNANQKSLQTAAAQGILQYEDPSPTGPNRYYRIEIIP
jgi:hypothetical protein